MVFDIQELGIESFRSRQGGVVFLLALVADYVWLYQVVGGLKCLVQIFDIEMIFEVKSDDFKNG